MKNKIKLCTQIPAEVDDSFLSFLEQLGIGYVYAWYTPEQFSYDNLCRVRDMCAGHNIVLNNVACNALVKNRDIILGGARRDQAIDRFNAATEMISKAGIYTTTFVWEPDGVWASDWDYPTRGGALTRKCDMRVLQGGGVDPRTRYTQIEIDREMFAREGLTHGRVYTLDEMWENYSYFIRRAAPVAEEFGVRLALHPNDPPVPSVGGVACLIKSFEDYKRAFAIADSKNVGMEFCCGCWLEAADSFGPIDEAIKHFVAEGRVCLVHFRNVDRQLPCFTETFIDDGYGDMLSIMKLFMQAGYDSTLVMDHSPRFIREAGIYSEAAFANGYIKALMKCAESLL